MTHRRLAASLFLVAAFAMTGCATTRARRPVDNDSAAQIAALQSELQSKDQQIQDLQYQLQSRQSRVEPGFASGKRSTAIRVAGVSPMEVQQALVRAGLDPGTVDGHIGKQTRRAIKQFQQKNDLTADGIVGEKTWALLKSS